MKKNKQFVYSHYKELWNNKIQSVSVCRDKLQIETIQNGVVLPPKRIGITQNNHFFAGGLCTKDGEFVAGQIRQTENLNHNRVVHQSYDFEFDELEYVDEEVVFGGVLTNHFGHVITDSLTRFWYIIKNLDKKIIFVSLYKKAEVYDDIFRIIGLNNYEVIETPTAFKKVIVPQESAHFLSSVNTKQKDIYKYIIKNNDSSIETHDKLYLSRMEFSPYELNEQYYADFFARRGYFIVSPEKYSFSDQVKLINSAKEIACSIGTLSHLALFAKENTKLYCIVRNPTELIVPQIAISKLMNIESHYFEGTTNYLPSKHYESALLYYPTEYFVEFLQKNNITYKNKEIVISDEKRNELVYQYLYKWYSNYSVPKRQKRIRNTNSLDILDSLSYVFTKENIDVSSYFPPESVKEIETKTKQINSLQNSVVNKNAKIKQLQKETIKLQNKTNKLQTELQERKTTLNKYKTELQERKTTLNKYKTELQERKKILNKYKKELNIAKKSMNYRVGKIITWLPKKIYYGLKNILRLFEII